MGLFTGQIGYAWNNSLLYLKGGAAVTSNRLDVVQISNRHRQYSTPAKLNFDGGGVVGIRWEYGFASELVGG